MGQLGSVDAPRVSGHDPGGRLLFPCQVECARPIGAVVCLAVNWFGDSLDGTLARVRDKQRPRYGFYVDHIVDSFGAIFLIGGLGLSGYMTGTIAMGVIIAYFLLAIEIYLATYTIGVFRLSFGVWGPTELRIVLGIGSLILLARPVVTVSGEQYLLCDLEFIIRDYLVHMQHHLDQILFKNS